MTDDAPTGFVIHRVLQRDLLERMRAAYPGKLYDLTGIDNDATIGQLAYLGEHGLCDDGLSPNMNGTFVWKGARITAAGLDFLEEDGGLTAILGVVTVKLHADTIRGLLAAKIDASDLPEAKKSAMREAISKLPSAALTAATGDLAKMGLEHAPGALHWIERLVGMIG